MLRRDLLGRYDIERRVHERLFCFGSGSSDEGGGGDDSPAAEDTQANYEQEAFGGSSNPVVDIVTMGRPMSEPPPVINTPLKRDIAESMFQDFAATLPPAPIDSTSTPVNLGNISSTPVNLGNVAATNITSVPASDTVNMQGSYGRIDTTGNPATDVLGFDYDPRVPLIQPLPADLFDISQVPPAPVTVMGMEDEYDPFAGTGRTAMDLLNYDLDDQSGPAGRIRPFAGLTRAQQADLEARDDFVARQILDAQTAQPSGIPITNLTGIYTEGDAPMGNVRGFANFGPELPFLGPTQVFTGFGGDPFAAQAQVDDDQTTPPEINPLTGASRCPDGFIFDEGLQTCRRKTTAELAETGSGGSPAPMASGGGAAAPQPGDIFYRRSILDDAPANLPQGFDFDAANRRFIQTYGVRPENYRMPLSLTGFTAL